MRKLLLLFFVLCTGFVFGQFPTFDGVDLRQYAKTRKYMYFVPNASAPAGVKMGAVYFDTDTTLYYFNGVAWLPVGGTDYFHLRGTSADTITASYNVLQDSSFQVHYLDNWYFGMLPRTPNDPYDYNIDTAWTMGYVNDAVTRYAMITSGSFSDTEYRTTICSKENDSTAYIDVTDKGIGMYSSNNTTTYGIGIDPDSIVLTGENIYLPDITAPVMGKFEHIIGQTPDGRLFPKTLAQLIDSANAQGALYWTKTTNAVKTTTATDTVKILKILKLPAATATTGIIYKDASPWLHDFYKTGSSGKNVWLGEAGNLTLTGSATGDDGSNNIGIGYLTLKSLTTGKFNVAIGYRACEFNTTGLGNTNVGYNAGQINAAGTDYTTFLGYSAGRNNDADYNTAVGALALTANTTGHSNTAVGANSLDAGTVPYEMTAIGLNAMGSCTYGYGSVAIGVNALGSSDSIVTNIAIGNDVLKVSKYACNVGLGAGALSATVYALDNIAIGTGAMARAKAAAKYGTTWAGSENVVIGVYAGDSINYSGEAAGTGTGNVLLGHYVMNRGRTINKNVAIGWLAGYSNITGDSNVYVGNQAGYTGSGSHNIFIGDQAGKYITGSYKGVIDVGDKSTYANDTTQSLLFMNFATDKLTINGDIVYGDTYWNDMNVTDQILSFAGVADPALVTYQAGGGSGMVTKIYEFEKNDIAYFKIQVPHDIKAGSDFKVHVHWTPGDRGNEEGTATVGWKVVYSIASIDAAFPNSVITVDCSDATTSTDHVHLMTTPVTSDPGTVSYSDYIIGYVIRTDTGGDDTWASGTTGQLPLFLGVDFHYESDKPGTDN